MRRSVLFSLSLALVALAAAASAGEPTPDSFTVEEFLAVPTLGTPVLSPDGKLAAYVRLQRLVEEDRYERQLWICPTDGGEPRRLTFDGGAVWSLGWRPDGALCFLAGRGEDPQVWINPLDGSEPRPVR